MRALTLKQPWLYAIEHLGKRVENRSWVIPKKLRGQWIALHAGKSRDMEEWHQVELISGQPISMDPIYGAITSIAKFGDFFVTKEYPYSLHVAQQKWFSGPYGWVIFDIVFLDKPLYCRGMLGLWPVPGEIEEKIREQLPSLAYESRHKEMQL